MNTKMTMTMGTQQMQLDPHMRESTTGQLACVLPSSSNPANGRISAGMAFLLTTLLVGCGGSDDTASTDNAIPPSPVGSVMVMDGFGAVKPNAPTRVDLTAFIRGKGATLTALESQQSGCHADKLSGLSAELSIDGSGMCQYTFTASNGASEASASLNMLASSSQAPVLPPLSEAMTVGTANATFDLQTLLGTSWPSGYTLDPDSLVVQGGAVQGTVTVNGNTLSYTPPLTPDWNRIVFLLKNSAKPDEDVIGTLYVTVSDIVNKAPVIGTPKYDYNVQTGKNVAAGERVEVDLATLVNLNITDPENRDWQLVEVQTYSASVSPVDPTSVTNKRFNFTAGSMGTHIVSYIVGDHEGGFTTGLMSITVGATERPKTWSDITITDRTFFATPLFSEAARKGVVAAEGVWDPSVNTTDSPPGNTIAGLTAIQASAYCNNGSRLPTQNDLDTLRTTAAVSAQRNNYPTQRGYLISNDGGKSYLTYNLTTGATAAYTPGTTLNQYALCVKYANDGNLVYIPNPDTPSSGYQNTAISDGNWWSLGDIISEGGTTQLTLTRSTNLGTGTLSAANFRLTPAGCTTRCRLEAKAAQEEYGDASLRLTNSNNNVQTLIDIGPVTFWRNIKLVSAKVAVDNSPANSFTANKVLASLNSEDGNPIPAGTQVKLAYTITPSTGVTATPSLQNGLASFTANAQGEVSLDLVSSVDGLFKIEFSPPPGGIASRNQTLETRFAPFNTLKIDLTLGCPLIANGTLKDGGFELTCPPVPAELDRLGIKYTGTYRDAVGSIFGTQLTYATMNIIQGTAYCNAIGYRMPTRDELTRLSAAAPNFAPEVGKTWPFSEFWLGERVDAYIYFSSMPYQGSVNFGRSNQGSDLIAPLPQVCIR